MKTIPEDYRAELEVTVTDAMTVDFGQDDPRLGRLHPVYATYWLTKHVELVSRKIILPFLETGEEGIGHAVHVTHLAPALPGMRVRLTARFAGQEGNRVFADVRAFNELGDVVGEGGTTQVILPAAKLGAAFARLRERWEETRAGSEPGPRTPTAGDGREEREP